MNKRIAKKVIRNYHRGCYSTRQFDRALAVRHQTTIAAIWTAIREIQRQQHLEHLLREMTLEAPKLDEGYVYRFRPSLSSLDKRAFIPG